jgi:anaerobic selenocysteine-containing dehydrogenase
MLSSQSQVIRTMCPMSCHPTLCGMLVKVEDGHLVQVQGDRENPDSQGFLCVRGQSASEVIDNPKRLLHPLIRERRCQDAWRQVSWETALDLIVDRMQAAGRQRVGLWSGHGVSSTNYGTRIGGQLLKRFANFYGCQTWSGTMICWGLGAFGLGVTGILETHTKEDMGQNANLIVLWGANLVSQPNTARHLATARRRGAGVITIDVRQSEAAERSDDVFLLRPGTDAALALAMMHVMITEDRYDHAFVARHTVGFDALARHVQSYSPAWAADITGIEAERIVSLARRYAAARPAMIVLGGSSLHKGANSWLASRAISCLPALSGNLGIPGGGFGPRHGSSSHGQALNSIAEDARRPPGTYIPNQMSEMIAALCDGRVKAMLLFGTNMISSFADAEHLATGLARAELVVSYDIFMNDTARRFADVVLPSTSWLEQLGCKSTNTHLYLMPQALEPPGETRPLSWILQQLGERLGLQSFFPWASEAGAIDAILDHPSTGHATVASLRDQGGIAALQVSHVAYPEHHYHTPSGRVEFYSARAQQLGLPPQPVYEAAESTNRYPLMLSQGRTISHFHSFYDHGQALPALAKLEARPRLWLSAADAAVREIVDGMPIRIYNARGDMQACAHVTDHIPPGTVWMRDGWEGLNCLTSGDAVLPDAAVDIYGFSAGQSRFEARVEVTPL